LVRNRFRTSSFGLNRISAHNQKNLPEQFFILFYDVWKNRNQKERAREAENTTVIRCDVVTPTISNLQIWTFTVTIVGGGGKPLPSSSFSFCVYLVTVVVAVVVSFSLSFCYYFCHSIAQGKCRECTENAIENSVLSPVLSLFSIFLNNPPLSLSSKCTENSVSLFVFISSSVMRVNIWISGFLKRDQLTGLFLMKWTGSVWSKKKWVFTNSSPNFSNQFMVSGFSAHPYLQLPIELCL